jgi:hypothetical protein
MSSGPYGGSLPSFVPARFRAPLLRRFGSVRQALAAYNAGSGAVAGCGCVPAYPETVAYATRIWALRRSGIERPALTACDCVKGSGCAESSARRPGAF